MREYRPAGWDASERVDALAQENRGLRLALERIRDRLAVVSAPGRDDIRPELVGELTGLVSWGLYFSHAGPVAADGSAQPSYGHLKRRVERVERILQSMPEAQGAWNAVLVEEANRR